MNDQIRRNMALFPIGIVMKLTELTARQIRYYEQHGLIHPARTKGNQRLFSFNDVDRLLEIKSLLEKGLNLAGIKQVLQMQAEGEEARTVINHQSEQKRNELTDQELHQMLKKQIIHGGRNADQSMIRGQLSRFFH